MTGTPLPASRPTISGYTFLRNGVKLGYPFIESLRSLAPLCDEIVLALGPCDDDTEARLLAADIPGLRILRTQWNESMRDRGFVYAQQKMIAHYNCTGDWAFYLEGDEVLHEDDIAGIRQAVTKHHADARVEAFAFRYRHFYGSPDFLAVSPGWYRTEVRLVRNSIRWFAPDGLFSVVMDKNKKGRYPRAVLLDATIHHYGHARKSEYMTRKSDAVQKYWSKAPERHAYDIDPAGLAPFTGKHPAVIGDWLRDCAETGFRPDPERRPTRKDRRHRFMMRLERLFGCDLSKNHFLRVRI